MTNKFETDSIGRLLLKQAIPATVGILVMSLNMIVDTIFVGRWISVLAIAAITVVLPIAFLISSIGMGIGMGGSSIISRNLGEKNHTKAFNVFGNQISLTVSLSIFFVVLGIYFGAPILKIFGAHGDIVVPATEYFNVIIMGVPFLAFAMMGNPVIRALGKPNYAMTTMILPAIINIILDIIFIKFLNLGMFGAGLATSISYGVSGLFVLWFFLSKHNELKIIPKYFILNIPILKEIISLGGVSIVRQGVISILIIVMNHSLFVYGGEISISVYGIINRIMMFILSPVLGVMQAFLPVAGFNIGAKNALRVKETVKKSILFGTGVATFIFVIVLIFSKPLVGIFTNDKELLNLTPKALVIAFLATPVITIQLIGSAYFQAAGRALPALMLTLLKQGFCLIPLVYLLPKFYGVNGVWISFPIADVLSTIITYIFLHRALNSDLKYEN
ncbi:putative efflux protein, MATE family [Tenacibaculum sp. MAR_2009_124]|uniref:MATE family efflux transporter n=1 Tax=Tenacibaculum sp. MAR_2009_124 TaxID=1250059 RepID=UPI00089ABA9B|nr:MATE family efflux transporter [Tenacibaculum sp. MAR_2009_124]SEB38349.1 putative efflux protein, MATE family [Tenacibaculum sp. MAR_2009_124]